MSDGRAAFPVHEVVATRTTAALVDQYACLKVGKPQRGMPQKDLVQLSAAVKTASTGAASSESTMGGSADPWATEKAVLLARTAAFVKFAVSYPGAAPRSKRSPVSIRECVDGPPTILVNISEHTAWDNFFNGWLAAAHPQGTRKSRRK